jgi:leucyl aminopeptidase
MTIQINYKTSNSKKVSSNLVLFVDEKFNISGLKKHISNSEFSYISDLLKNSDLKKVYSSLKLTQKKQYF